MQRVLVTGAAGFLGANLTRRLLAEPSVRRVVGLDALTYAGSRASIPPIDDRHVFVEASVCDPDAVAATLADHDIDTVFHLAAETHVDRSIADAIPFAASNVLGTATLLECVRRAWRGPAGWRSGVRLHQVSTDEVFGARGDGEAPSDEESPWDPRSPYAATKAGADHLVRAFAHTHGLPASISWGSNTYGPYQHPEKLIPLTIMLALAGEPIPVYGDGGQVREWLHVDDLVEGLLAVVRVGRPGSAYVLATGRGSSNLEVVEALCRLVDEAAPRSTHVPHRSLIRLVADRPGHDRRYALSPARARAELGWQPRRTLEDGLRQTVSWYLANGAWCEAWRRAGFDRWLAVQYGERTPR